MDAIISENKGEQMNFTQEYCLNCEEMVLTDGFGHSFFIEGTFPPEIEWCNGNFVDCAPPELEEDWQYNLQDPSPAELEEMNANAEELMIDLGIN